MPSKSKLKIFKLLLINYIYLISLLCDYSLLIIMLLFLQFHNFIDLSSEPLTIISSLSLLSIAMIRSVWPINLNIYYLLLISVLIMDLSYEQVIKY